jgi:4-amino-4-deoxy-L-arabinose transferase-like glycosyltransferase
MDENVLRVWFASRPARTLLPCVLILLLAGLRLVALDSDAYARLCWSAGLLTDEGFYMHNARNRILFGQERTDEFNNALLMPLLHSVQVAVFTLFGVGSVQARLISVFASWGTLLLFFLAMRRAFGEKVACVGTLFLGFDHVFLLYNRLALMDTPATLPMTGAFYAFLRGVAGERRQKGWLLLCGLLMGLAYTTRGLAAFLFPVPFLACLALPNNTLEPPKSLWKVFALRLHQSGAVWILAGLGIALTGYLVWSLPHRAELSRVNAYYFLYQLRPRSLSHVGNIVGRFFFGDERGMSPYLFRHTPVLFLLACAGMVYYVGAGRKTALALTERVGLHFVGWWLLTGWAIHLMIGYSPSRYYVLFYPALCAVAARGLCALPSVLAFVLASRFWRMAFGGFAAYHIALALLHRRGSVTIWGVGLTVAAALLVCGFAPGWQSLLRGRRPAGIALAFWAAANGLWLQDWLRTLDYTQRDAERWIAAHLPPDSILIGDVGPGLCRNHPMRALNVIPNLCNYDRPVERMAPARRYIVILDEHVKEKYWLQTYPHLVAPERRLRLFPRLVKYPVGLYPVE